MAEGVLAMEVGVGVDSAVPKTVLAVAEDNSADLADSRVMCRCASRLMDCRPHLTYILELGFAG